MGPNRRAAAARIDLFLRACIGIEEYRADPEIAAMDEGALAMLAALNGHTVRRSPVAA